MVGRPAAHRVASPRSARRLRLESLESRQLLAGVWNNDFNSLDVNDDGFVLPMDVLVSVNDLNRNGARTLGALPDGVEPPAFLDVNDDGSASPVDSLILINQLNLGSEMSLVALGEGSGFVRQTARSIELGQLQGTRTLRFDLAAEFATTGSESVVHDTLLIYLVDPESPSETLLDGGVAGSALFALTPGGAEFPEEIVEYDGTHVAIDLTSLADRSEGRLIIQLLNHDGEMGSKALLRSLRSEVDPDGTPTGLIPQAVVAADESGPVNVDWLMANSDLQVLVENVRFDAGSGRYGAEVRLRNQGDRVGREVAVEFVGLPPEVQLVNAAGTADAPYLNFSRAIGANGLGLGEESMALTLLLDNPDFVPFLLSPNVLAPDPITTTRVSGTVQNEAGEPLAGVPIELAGFTTTTGPDGQFHLEMPAGHVPTQGLYVQVPTGDPMFDPLGEGDAWIPMNRAQFDPSTGTSLDNPRRHPNMITTFIDASMVYGSDATRADALRVGDGTGMLKVDAEGMLPRNNTTFFPEGPLEIDNPGPLDNSRLFAAGDVRASENPGLTSLQTLFVREHNRKAQEIAAAEPDLSGDEVYDRARQWVGALIQHITFQEFLPMLLGSGAVPGYTGYDSSVDPRIGGLFSGAVYRLGHSMVTEDLWRLDEQGDPLPDGPLALRDGFFNSEPIVTDGIEPYLRGMANQPAERLDAQVVDSLRNFLFGPPGAGGLDLVSLNIQRGRDMGLPGYNELRRQLDLEPAADFADISSDPDVEARLESVYASVEQVDVWVGGLAEDRVEGSMLGATFVAVLQQQFLDLRDGDRFWYENGQLPATELAAVRGTLLSDVIRRNTDVVSLADHVFTLGAPPLGPAAGGQPADGVPDVYRSADGSDNNVEQRWLGQTGDQLKMDYDPAFADGMAMPAGADRPSGRMISSAVFAQSESIPDPSGATSMLTAWGQFVDHDVSLTPSGKDDRLTVHGETLDDPLETFAASLDDLLGRSAYARFDNVIEQPIVLR